MKIVKKVINFRKRVFAVRMNLDENTDDVWNVYNLLSVGDFVTGTCHRKVQKEVQGLVKIDKKCFVCTLLIKSFVYDPENDSLRINGVNATENKWIGMGASQSMEIRPPRQLLIVKKVFDSMHVRRLDQMIKEADSGHLVAITMEEGIANLFVVSQSKTILKSKIEKSISKNKGVGNKHASSKGKFFDQVISALEKNFTGEQQQFYTKVNCIIVGSPGFVAENFLVHLKEAAAKKGSAFLADVHNKIVVGHCSSGFKHSLNELLSSQSVVQKISGMSCSNETQILDKFFETLAMASDKCTYGPKSVSVAMREMAVETLLISDKLFRSKNIEQRKFYVGLHDQASRDGVNVVIFNSMSPPGIRLNNLTGIASILRYVLPQLEEMVEADEGDIDSDEEQTSSNDNEDEEIDQDSNDQEESKSYKTGESPGDMDDILNAMGGMDYDDELDEGEDIMETMSDPKVKKAQSLQ